MGKEGEVVIKGLDNIDMGLDNVNVDMGLDNIKVDMGLKDVNVDMNMGLDNVNVDMGLDDVNVDMGLDNVKVDMGLDNINVCMSFAIKEFPSMRVHFPMDFAFGVKMLGMEVLGFSICGKAMVLTEDNPRTMFYTPNRTRADRNTQRDNTTFNVKLQEEKNENQG